MKKDATRKEAIKWCIDNKADFIRPIFPPPEGWSWANGGDQILLTAVFTNTKDADITTKTIEGIHKKLIIDINDHFTSMTIKEVPLLNLSTKAVYREIGILSLILEGLISDFRTNGHQDNKPEAFCL